MCLVGMPLQINFMQRRTQQLQRHYLTAIAEVLTRSGGASVEQYLNDHELLDRHVTLLKPSWEEIAARLNTKRRTVYMWYIETFRRSLFPEMTQEDKEVIARELVRSLLEGLVPGSEFQQQLKAQLS